VRRVPHPPRPLTLRCCSTAQCPKTCSAAHPGADLRHLQQLRSPRVGRQGATAWGRLRSGSQLPECSGVGGFRVCRRAAVGAGGKQPGRGRGEGRFPARVLVGPSDSATGSSEASLSSRGCDERAWRAWSGASCTILEGVFHVAHELRSPPVLFPMRWCGSNVASNRGNPLVIRPEWCLWTAGIAVRTPHPHPVWLGRMGVQSCSRITVMPGGALRAVRLVG
jgi:hypothetical protein